VIAEEGAGGRALVIWRAAAFGGVFFVQIFCGYDCDDYAGPIGDGVAEERAEMRVGVGLDVEDYPAEQNGARRDAQRMALQEAFFVVIRGFLG